MSMTGAKINFAWTRANIDVEGKEIADQLVKYGVKNGQEYISQLPMY